MVRAHSLHSIVNRFSVGCDDSNFSLAISMETVEDCSSFLWNEPGNSCNRIRIM